MPTPDELHPRGRRDAHGLASRDLDRIENLFGKLWYELPGRFAAKVLRAVEGAPNRVFENRPRLLHAVLLGYHRMTFDGLDDRQLRRTTQFYVAMGQRYGTRLSSFTRPGDLVAGGVAAAVSGRMRGELDEAEPSRPSTSPVASYLARRTGPIGAKLTDPAPASKCSGIARFTTCQKGQQ